MDSIVQQQGKATLIAVLEDIRDGRRTDLSYDQQTFGGMGHGACLAHIAYSLEFGVEQAELCLQQAVKAKYHDGGGSYLELAELMRQSAKRLLGMAATASNGLFGTYALSWPKDIGKMYESDRYGAAIEAINRVQYDGFFAPVLTSVEEEICELV